MMLKSLIFIIMSVLFALNANAACNIVNGKAYGDCAGVTVSQNTKGIITVSSYQSESGVIDGARVKSGGSLSLSGICNGNIEVSKGGTLTVTGIVNGTVKNNGGIIEIEGQVSHVSAISGKTTIGGIVSGVSGESKIIYRSGAVIGGVPKP